MVKWPKILALALLSGGMPVLGPAQAQAATSATIDILSGDRAGEADAVDLGSVKPISKSNREAVRPRPSGNPLWSVPLSVLSATQERPMFSASRRPPQRAVAAVPVNEAVVAPQKAVEPEHPPLALIGAVVGDNDAIAVFLDRANQKIVRLRQGETHDGWVLSSVLRREVTLKKADRSEVLVLERTEIPAAAAGVPAMPVSTTTVPGPGGTQVPFRPRATPKNGQSDGL